jgi:periplasmic protein TonB
LSNRVSMVLALGPEARARPGVGGRLSPRVMAVGGSLLAHGVLIAALLFLQTTADEPAPPEQASFALLFLPEQTPSTPQDNASEAPPNTEAPSSPPMEEERLRAEPAPPVPAPVPVPEPPTAAEEPPPAPAPPSTATAEQPSAIPAPASPLPIEERPPTPEFSAPAPSIQAPSVPTPTTEPTAQTEAAPEPEPLPLPPVPPRQLPPRRATAPAARSASPSAPPVDSRPAPADAGSGEPVLPSAPSGPVTPARPVSGLASNARPDYPESARRRGEQGRVMVRVAVSAQGSPAEVAVSATSGHPSLDAAAVEAVRKWRFVPATQGGRPVPSVAEVPIRFLLED